ncbi:hypothetical protein FJT64_027308 [Amphibalanus amphitrite]|uniref:Uncharacterized protein n=1 Tax=Amphibalanus amphitrite TaxID=1232801 RepID=A0A6A4WDS6_AMPAM|nr:hypothetical protein FJT64_027308 [Amphibalanus amphitrite]
MSTAAAATPATTSPSRGYTWWAGQTTCSTPLTRSTVSRGTRSGTSPTRDHQCRTVCTATERRRRRRRPPGPRTRSRAPAVCRRPQWRCTPPAWASPPHCSATARCRCRHRCSAARRPPAPRPCTGRPARSTLTSTVGEGGDRAPTAPPRPNGRAETARRCTCGSSC